LIYAKLKTFCRFLEVILMIFADFWRLFQEEMQIFEGFTIKNGGFNKFSHRYNCNPNESSSNKYSN